MYDIDYIKTHLDEFEEDVLFKNFTKQFALNFIPMEQYSDYGLEYTGDGEPITLEWTEENVIGLLVDMVKLGYEVAILNISCENIMIKVANSWCKVLQNGINLNNHNDLNDIQKLLIVAEHYGFRL